MTTLNRAFESRSWSRIPAGSADLKLIACDMDGTLVLPDGRLPEELWPLLERLGERGITFVPASGRQYATLAAMFEGRPGRISFIAENGNLVVHQGQVISSDSLEPGTVHEVIDLVRGADRDLGLVVCGRETAWIERTDAGFEGEVRRYYAELRKVSDLHEVEDTVLKLAIYDADDSATVADTMLEPLSATHQVVVSGSNWVDIMTPWADKGRALRRLQAELGLGAQQTAAFGDYHNDLELLAAAQWSFAMANAHPDVIAAARYIAPANSELGVIRVLEHLLGL